MKRLIALSLLIFAFSDASEEALVFEAEEAVYDGSALTLSGNVQLEHEAGALSSGQAVIYGSSEGKKLQLSQVDLYDHVKFELSEGGTLSCAEAHLNQETSLGEFLGNPAHPFVVYIEQCRDASGSQERFPLIVKSRTMIVEFKPGSEKTSKNHIQAIIAKKNVTVDYNHDFIAAADLATFHRDGHIPSQKGLSGVICLHAEGEEGHCHVTNRNGDLIHARQIFVDTLNRRLSFAHPKGALFREGKGAPKERLDFSSDTLTWDEQRGALNLRGHVTLAEKGLGEMKTDDQMTLFHLKKQLNTIESSGHTTLIHRENLSHTLQCWGKMVVDHPNLKVTMASPELSQPQVFYEDDHGSLYADRAEIKYDWVEGAIKPVKMILEGHIKMISKPSKQSEKQQFALADRVDVFPQYARGPSSCR